MAELIRHKHVPKDCTIVATSDWHFGSKAHHAEAFAEMVERVKGDSTCYWIHGGDEIEGKPVKSQHFDPRSLDSRYLTIESQIDGVCEAIAPIADKCLSYQPGNHSIYLMPDIDIVKLMCDRLGMPRGGYQTIIDLGHVRVFSYHGRRSMPRGAKDPIQREANQKAWLVNTLAPLNGGCHVQLMGHVHALMVQPPLEQLALLARGNSVRARHFYEPVQTVKTRDPGTGKVDHREYIPPYARWYGITGTFRRSGGFGWMDYAEIAGYPPSLIGWLEIDIRDGVVSGIRKVVA